MDSFSEDLIGSNELGWCSRSVDFNLIPKSFTYFLEGAWVLMTAQLTQNSANWLLKRKERARWEKMLGGGRRRTLKRYFSSSGNLMGRICFEEFTSMYSNNFRCAHVNMYFSKNRYMSFFSKFINFC